MVLHNTLFFTFLGTMSVWVLLATMRHIRAVFANESGKARASASLWLVLRRIGVLLALPLMFILLSYWTAEDISSDLPVLALKDLQQTEPLGSADLMALGTDAWAPVSTEASAKTKGRDTLSMEMQSFHYKIPLPLATTERKYVANINFAILYEVQFFVVSQGRITAQGYYGNAKVESGRTLPGLHPTFSFTIAEGQSADLYVRVKNSGINLIPLSVMELGSFVLRDQRIRIINGLIVGALLGILVYNLSLFISLKEKIYFYYAWFHGPAAFLLLGYLDFLSPLLGSRNTVPVVLQLSVFCAIFATILAFAIFAERMLQLKANQHTMRQCLRSIMPLCFGAVLLVPIMDHGQRVISSVVGLSVSSTFAIIGLGVYLKDPLFFKFLVGFVGLCSGMLVHVLSLMDWMPFGSFSSCTLSLGILWDAMLVSGFMSAQIDALRHQNQRLVKTLSGAEPQASAVTSSASEIGLPRRQRRVAIMVVDVANFSMIADRIGSVAVYKALSRKMGEMRAILSRYGGSVDRSLGDGLLAFFTEGGESGESAPHRAFKAALDIQALPELKRDLVERSGLEVSMPLRVGIHWDEVLIGNLGGLDRIDFTMIGSGVHFARRLETSANPHKIIVSQEFRTALGPVPQYEPGFNKIYVAVNYQDQLIAGYEYNPFAGVPELLQGAERHFLNSLGLATRDARVRYSATTKVVLKSAYGDFRVKDLSQNGMGVMGEAFIGRKAILDVEIEPEDGAIRLRLGQALLNKVQVEVRWCRERGGLYEHGLRLVGLNDLQKSTLYSVLKLAADAGDLAAGTRNSA